MIIELLCLFTYWINHNYPYRSKYYLNSDYIVVNNHNWFLKNRLFFVVVFFNFDHNFTRLFPKIRF